MELALTKQINVLNNELAYCIAKLDQTVTDDGYFYWWEQVDNLRNEIKRIEKQIERRTK